MDEHTPDAFCADAKLDERPCSDESLMQAFGAAPGGGQDVSSVDLGAGASSRRGGSSGGDNGTSPSRTVAAPRMARVVGTMVVAAGLIFAGSAFLVGKLTTVRPLHAAAAGDTLLIRAPGSGVVVWVNSAPTVAAGDAVVTMSTYRSREATAQLDQAIALGEQNLQSKTDAARDVQRTFATYRRASSMDVAMGKAAKQSIDEQVRLQTDRVERLAKLSAEGFVSRDTMDAEEIKLVGLKRQSLEARHAVEEFELARASAAQGYHLDQGRTTQTSVLDMQREQTAAAQELQRLKLLRSSARPLERIEAPCRCTIGSWRVQRGEYVSEGEPLLSLNRQVPGAGQLPLRVEAVVPLDQIAKIKVGSRAAAWLPGTKKAYRGNVVRISYDLKTASNGGLPKQVLEMGGAALVVVSLPDTAGLTPLENGTPVKLELRTGLAAALGF